MEVAQTTRRHESFRSNNYARNYNVPPSHNLAVIVHKNCDAASQRDETSDVKDQIDDDFDNVRIEKHELKDNRKLTVMKWGWLDTKVINCRGEELTEKPMFRPHLNEHRCVVVVEGAFEWTPDKEPHKYVREGADHLFIAGLFNKAGEVILLTVNADEKLGKVHHRMPVLLKDSMIDEWIDPSTPFNDVNKYIIDTNCAYTDVDAVKVSKLVSHLENKGSDVILSEKDYFEKNKKAGKSITSFFDTKKPENHTEASKSMKNKQEVTLNSKIDKNQGKETITVKEDKNKREKSKRDASDEKPAKVYTSKRIA